MTTRRGFFSVRATWAGPAFALITMGLGIWGWLDHGLRPMDAAYRAVALFDIGNSYYTDPPASTDWRFQIGRWTGLASLWGAAFIAVGAVLQERVALAVARFVRQEVVVIGEEGVAAKAFELGAGSIRSIALPWPPVDHARTVIEHAGGADHILVAQEDDAGALVLARAARLTAPSAFITVLMRDARLAEDAAATLNEPRARVLSVAAVSARALSLEHPSFLIAKDLGHPRIHALIIGFGQTGQAIARDLIVNCRTTYLELPWITVIDPHARALEGVIRVRAPEIDACAHFNFIEGMIGSEAIAPDSIVLGKRIAEGGPVTTAYVCLRGDAEALSAAAMLQSLLRSVDIGRPSIFVRLRDAQTVLKGSANTDGLNALTPFGDLEAVLTASEFLSNTPDSAARAFCAAYRASLPPDKRDDPKNRSARPWDELDETFRQNNRDVVAHIPAKMASAGIAPDLWRAITGLPHPGPGTRLYADGNDLERLGELEHERWDAQRRMDGWRWANLPSKDEARRLHPSLVAYDCLTDEVKEYDRVNVRETQLACWGVT